MSIIRCPECGKEISDKARSCPNCGCPNSEFSRQENSYYSKQPQRSPMAQQPQKGGCFITTLKILAILVILFVVLAVIGGQLNQENEKDSSKKSESSEHMTEIQETTERLSRLETEAETIVQTEPEPETIVQTERPVSDVINFEYNDCHVKYIRHEITENMAGEQCIAIFYEFTNNSSDGKTFSYVFNDKVFQNGMEDSFSLFHVNEESKNSGKEIQPGATVTVCSGFVLQDLSDVTLEVEPFISFSDKNKHTQILKLQ